MKIFTISDSQLVGNELLDAQHRVIMGYMSKIHGNLLAGKSVSGLMARLDSFCRLHFLEEEEVMEEIGFPAIDEHKAQHALFVTHLENFVGKYEGQNVTKNIEEFTFLKDWFMEHIETFDRKYTLPHKKPTKGRQS